MSKVLSKKKSLFFGISLVVLTIAILIGIKPAIVNAINAGWIVSGNNIYNSGGKVGIGIDTPSRLLHLAGTAPEIQFTDTDSSGKNWHIGGAGNDFLITETAVNIRMAIKAGTGNIGIGTTAPLRDIHIKSSDGAQIKFQGTGSGSWLGTEWNAPSYQGYSGMIESDGRYFVDVKSDGKEELTIKQNGSVNVLGTLTAGSYACSSDRRFKKDIKTIDNSLRKLMKLDGVSYYWRTDEFKDKSWPVTQQIGLIAQDVEKVLPQVVLTNDEGYKSVDYDKLSAVIINAIKEQQAVISNLEQQNLELKRELDIIKLKIK